MTDILVADVSATVEIDGPDTFHATYVQVDRNLGVNSGQAKVKGVLESPEELALDQRITIEINDNPIFDGLVKRAEQNEEGIITVEAYDLMIEMHDQLVKLNTEQPRFANEVARDLIDDAGYDVVDRSSDPDELDFGQAYVAPGSEFPTDDAPGNRAYGSAKTGERLTSVLEDLATKLGGYFWVDRRGVIRLEPYPPHRSYELKYITKLGGGDSSTERTRVLVKGGSATTELGVGAAHIYDQVSLTSSAQLDADEEKPATKTVDDDNIITQDEASSTAMKTALDVEQRQDAGEVTVVGSTDVRLFDTLIIPELEYEVYSPTVGAPSWVNTTVSSNEYTAGSVRHTIDKTEGYTTTIGLSKSTEDVLRNVTGPASRIADQLLTYVEGRRESTEILGIEGGSI